MEAREPAFETLLEHSGWLRQLARSLVRDGHRAEDAVQETLLEAFEQRGQAFASPRGWLGAVLRNRLRAERRSRVRRGQRERLAEEDSADRSAARHARSAPDEVLEHLELQSLVLEAVRGLEEPYRTAIVRRYFEGLPPRVIAAREGLPVKTVNTHLERGLQKLRARLDARFGDRRAWLEALLPLATRPWLTKTAPLSALGLIAVAGAAWLLLPSETERRSSDGPPSARALETAGELAPGAERTAAREPLAPMPARATSTLGEGEAELVLRVTLRPSGAPVAARVEIQLLTDRTEAAGRVVSLLWSETDADGSVRAIVPAARRLCVLVEPDDRDASDPVQRATTEVEALASGERRALALDLTHGFDRLFHGRVVASEDGRPLPGSRVVHLPLAADTRAIAVDGDGTFALPVASWSPGEFLVQCDGYGPKHLELRSLDQTADEPHVVFLERAAVIDALVTGLRGSRELELRAVSGWDPRNVPRHQVGDSRAEWNLEWLQDGVALDADGRATLSGLPPNSPLEIELRSEDGLVWRTAEPWTLAPGEHRPLELSFEAAGVLRGRVLDQEGRALADQELWALPAGTAERPVEGRLRFFRWNDRGQGLVTRTDAEGAFAFEELQPGDYWIGPEHREDGARVAARAVGVRLEPGERSRRLEIAVHRDLWIRGRVVGPEGLPLVAARVQGECSTVLGPVRTTADRGAFCLGPLVPGTYRLQVFGDGVLDVGEPVSLEAGTDDVVLEVGRLGREASIAGRVVDAEGRPTDAYVRLVRRGRSSGQRSSEREQGSFLFAGVEAGAYTLCAETPAGALAVREIVLGPREQLDALVLVPVSAARIGVRHDFEHAVRCSATSAGVLVADWLLRPGEQSFQPVPEGALRLELHDETGSLAVRELEARAGRVETVTFAR